VEKWWNECFKEKIRKFVEEIQLIGKVFRLLAGEVSMFIVNSFW